VYILSGEIGSPCGRILFCQKLKADFEEKLVVYG
jgi:hypothetical protein